MSKELTTHFEDTEQEPEVQPTAKDSDGIPYCRDHHCRMKLTSGGSKKGGVKYFKCQVPKCESNAQLIKTRREQVVPSTPVTCVNCSTDSKPVYCVRDKAFSDAVGIVLVCPECNWKSNKMATPQFAAQHHESRKRAFPRVAGIGDR